MKKKLKVTKDIDLIEVEPIPKHINFLYALLKFREQKESISHYKLPSLKNHKKFVLNSPYRYWFLIKEKEMLIGATYISKTNTLGLHLLNINHSVVESVLLFILERIKPLKPIPSIRNELFTINLNNNSNSLANIIRKIGGLKIQETYILDSKKL